MRTYLYKLTSDRGGAPCAPPPRPGAPALLTLSICKPAIRRTAQPGDRILGITSRTLATREGYPMEAVIYAAVVADTLHAREYSDPSGLLSLRPDCIYAFNAADGTLSHSADSRLHERPEYIARDIGRYPHYKNARTLLCTEFRYFGSRALPIPNQLPNLLRAAVCLGQGHRVFNEQSPESVEADALFQRLWKLPTRYTPVRVNDEAYGHTPRAQLRADQQPGVGSSAAKPNRSQHGVLRRTSHGL